MIPTFNQQVASWSSPPVDGVGYMPALELLALPADSLRRLMARMERTRYQGWRNWEGRWRSFFKLDTTHRKYVLDYGCGSGIEALQYARAGNDVAICDISKDNVRLAMRVLALEGFDCDAFWLDERESILTVIKPDVIHCVGVLHHIPDPIPVIQSMHAQLADDGELRLMVYSNFAWRIACGTPPPDVVEDDPNFERYWRRWDDVGGYADWYDVKKLQRRFGEWFWVRESRYLTEHGEYLGAILEKAG